MDQSLGMQGTSQFKAERPGDYHQKIKALGKKKLINRASKSLSVGSGFQQPGEPLNTPTPNLQTYEEV